MQPAQMALACPQLNAAINGGAADAAAAQELAMGVVHFCRQLEA